MKVSELLDEIKVDKKDLMDFLNSIGEDVKRTTSNVTDEGVEKAKAHFGITKKAEVKKEAPKVEEAKVDEPKKENPNKAENNAKQPKKVEKEEPKKKKNIIFVSNSNNAGTTAARPQNNKGQGPRPGQASSRPGANQVQHRIIKPITAPTAVDTTSDFRENARKLDEAQRVRNERNTANVEAKKADTTPKNDGNERVDTHGSDSNNKANNEGGQKVQSFDNNNRNNQKNNNGSSRNNDEGKRKNDRFKKDNDRAQSSVIENAPSSGKEDKRRNNKDQDKRNKKDLMYEDGDESRAKKAGKFIKP